MNFLFTDFLTTKSSLKIFGEYLKKLLKVLPFSKFLYDLLRMLRIECPQKCKKTCFEIQILDQIISRTKFLVQHNFSHLPIIQLLLSDFVLSNKVHFFFSKYRQFFSVVDSYQESTAVLAEYDLGQQYTFIPTKISFLS